MKISQFDFGRRSLFARKISAIFLLFRIFIFRAKEYWHVGLLDIFDWLFDLRSSQCHCADKWRALHVDRTLYFYNIWFLFHDGFRQIWNFKCQIDLFPFQIFYYDAKNITHDGASAFTFVWKEKVRKKKRCAQPGATSHNTNNVLPVSSKCFPKV